MNFDKYICVITTIKLNSISNTQKIFTLLCRQSNPLPLLSIPSNHVLFSFTLFQNEMESSILWMQLLSQMRSAFEIHPSYSTHQFIPFYCSLVFHHVYVPHLFSYPPINEHLSTRLYVGMFSFPMDKHMRKTGHYDMYIFKFVGNCQIFPNDNNVLLSYLQSMRSSCSGFSLAFGIFSFLPFFYPSSLFYWDKITLWLYSVIP